MILRLRRDFVIQLSALFPADARLALAQFDVLKRITSRLNGVVASVNAHIARLQSAAAIRLTADAPVRASGYDNTGQSYAGGCVP
ncbi:MAG: hypothetical protein SGI73_09860 [Chloroflexota bacterium]|nr:hypothetical protein [Chloroflexota bacterium]